MNITLDHYRIFHAVATHGSFSAAAQSLYISQPAVSQAVARLERALGGTLFIRAVRGVRLTHEGEALFAYVRRGLDLIARGEEKYREMQALEDGEVHIGASDMTLRFYLLPHLETFHSTYPRVKIRVTNGPTPDTLAALRAGRIDFGAVTAPVDTGGDIHVTPVAQVQDVLVAGAAYMHLRDRVVSFEELAALPAVVLEPNTSTRRAVDGFLAMHSTALKSEFELATSDLIVKFAARGLGIGCVVRGFAEDALRSGELFEVRLPSPMPPRDLCLATGNLPMSPAGRRLLARLMPQGEAEAPLSDMQ